MDNPHVDTTGAADPAQLAPCPICESTRTVAFQGTILDRHRAQYLACPRCGLLQAHRPTWLDEAYSSAIVALDTGVLERTLRVGRVVRALCGVVLRPSGPLMDVAGGYGLLVRYLRDHGWDAFWSDPYAENLTARGFEGKDGGRYDVVTAVEVLEHVEDPLDFVRTIFETTGCAALIVTTELISEPHPPFDEWWYYAPESGQHITFLSGRSLRALAARLDLHVYSAGGIHLLSARRRSRVEVRLCASRLAPLLAWITERGRASLTIPDHHRLVSMKQAPPTDRPTPAGDS